MTQLRKMMLEELQRRNYAETTIECYLRTVEDFSRHFHCSPESQLAISPFEQSRPAADAARTATGRGLLVG